MSIYSYISLFFYIYFYFIIYFEFQEYQNENFVGFLIKTLYFFLKNIIQNINDGCLNISSYQDERIQEKIILGWTAIPFQSIRIRIHIQFKMDYN